MKFGVGLRGGLYGVDGHHFKIDDTVFEAIEDESDGYRSMMSDVIEDNKTKGLVFYNSPYANVVVRENKTAGDYSSNRWENFDGYELYDEEHNHVWLEFGTNNSDDYYPCFHFFYQTLGEKFQRGMEA